MNHNQTNSTVSFMYTLNHTTTAQKERTKIQPSHPPMLEFTKTNYRKKLSEKK